MCRRQPREDLSELALVEPEVAFENDRENGPVVGGPCEVAALIELPGREAGPVAVDAAAADAAAQNPDDVAMAVVSAACNEPLPVNPPAIMPTKLRSNNSF